MGDNNDHIKLSDDVLQLYRVRKTCLKMLKNRGYNLPPGELEYNPAQFVKQFGTEPPLIRSTMAIGVDHKTDMEDGKYKKLFIFFESPEHKDERKKIGMHVIKAVLAKMQTPGFETYNAILVTREPLTPMAMQTLKLLTDSHYHVEPFQEHELLIDITEHELVPKHTMLTTKEKQALLAKYKLTEDKLPRIQENDPIARYFGMREGQVVKIVRPSETAGRYVTYRLVRGILK